MVHWDFHSTSLSVEATTLTRSVPENVLWPIYLHTRSPEKYKDVHARLDNGLNASEQKYLPVVQYLTQPFDAGSSKLKLTVAKVFRPGPEKFKRTHLRYDAVIPDCFTCFRSFLRLK